MCIVRQGENIKSVEYCSEVAFEATYDISGIDMCRRKSLMMMSIIILVHSITQLLIELCKAQKPLFGFK